MWVAPRFDKGLEPLVQRELDAAEGDLRTHQWSVTLGENKKRGWDLTSRATVVPKPW